jgi:hypothetical protein
LTADTQPQLPPTTAEIPKLPVLRTIARGYREAFAHVGVYVLQASIWAVAASALQYMLDYSWPLTRFGRDAAGPLAVAAYYTGTFAEISLMLLGYVVIAVSAYRVAIKDEPPAWRRSLRFSRRELRFLGLALVFFVAEYAGIILLALAGLMGANMVGADRWARILLATASNSVLAQFLIEVAASLLISATAMPFFGLAFPLAAIDAPPGLLRRAARLSRGHRGQLGAISFLAMLPFTGAAYLQCMAWEPAPGTIEFSAREAAFMLLGLLGVASPLARSRPHSERSPIVAAPASMRSSTDPLPAGNRTRFFALQYARRARAGPCATIFRVPLA